MGPREIIASFIIETDRGGEKKTLTPLAKRRGHLDRGEGTAEREV